MILRELAKRQAEIAALPIMKERERLWYDLNDGKTGHPLVTMEFHGHYQEIYPMATHEDWLLRSIEQQLLENIYKHEHYRDDRVIPSHVKLYVPNRFKPYSLDPKTYTTQYADGSPSMGYMYEHILHDLEAGIGLFQPSSFSVDAGLVEATQYKNIVEEHIGDILPVKLENPSFSYGSANTLVALMGMETMFTSILDYPELFHKIMRQLTDDYHAYIDALEAAGAILPNNDGSWIGQDSYGYTHDLPGAGELDRPFRLSDIWGYANFQETVGMSVPMFDEFFFSYMKEISDRCGLFAYGCCEPVDTLWEPCLSRLRNLRKLSVSPWNNEEFVGDRIRGTKICYHRKPSPNYISVDTVFDEAAFAKHMERTVKAARGCPLEITFRDIISVQNEPQRLGRAVEITRRAFAQHW
jgi:hypothetical protein